MSNELTKSTLGRLLIIEDDVNFAAVLARRLTRYHYDVLVENNLDDALNTAQQQLPNFVLLDMKVGDQNGIHILPALRQALPSSKIILLTGYASIATAVEAIKSGADDYLSKPIDAASLLVALDGTANNSVHAETKMTTARLEWEHIQQALKTNNGNISATARQLGLHRRTLQRKLAKKPQI
ncbi:response regulator [Psychrosphaera sp. B3R10]|uniref:response regulator transcription factor n=1 Tax=unclassified Psychrosphaera TaxID=2641570 RepID=UPI001C08CAF2|nr:MULTISPECIES: response regulator [unclassified Psychrosphaera]MBU2881203.1 response regulator [Psychrosphaera sp. I2R16]MBU2988308.1 response regulator [Psychrosphaera sp. B3R10]